MKDSLPPEVDDALWRFIILLKDGLQARDLKLIQRRKKANAREFIPGYKVCWVVKLRDSWILDLDYLKPERIFIYKIERITR